MTDQAPADEPAASTTDRVVVGKRSVDVVMSLVILGVAGALGFDSWRIGNAWASDGPEAGYFPFYLSVIMGVAALWGLVRAIILGRGEAGTFVTTEQLGRVMMVLVPTFLFCLVTQFLGIYVASFVLVAGFMWWVGRISPPVSLATAVIFTLALFVTFEIAFNVIMPKGPLEAALGF